MEFSKEQIEKAKQCKTLEELKEFAKNEGLNLSDTDAEKYFQATRVGELNDDDLDKVAGGKESWTEVDLYNYHVNCPFCGAEFYVAVKKFRSTRNNFKYECAPNTCGCGAIIDYMDGTMNFRFIKNGEKRTVET